MEKDKKEIDEFLVAINNLLNSKYILVDRRISDVLLSIADTLPVYNLIAECMINFDFKAEWQMATHGMYLKFPETDDRKISFIFCLLNNIDDGNIDITILLEKFFSYNPKISPYELFCSQVIVEFKRLILTNLNYVSENNTQTENFNNVETAEVDSSSENNIIASFEDLTNELHNLANEISHAKKLKNSYMQKQDIVAVISTFEQASREDRVEYFYGFMVTIKSVLQKNKQYKTAVQKICELGNKLILRG